MREKLRRRLRGLGLAALALGALHHTDHVFRGDHSGWPFTPHVTPFTFSLVVYPLLLIGVYQLSRDDIRWRYWLAVSASIALLVTFVHFVPLPKYERVSTDIFLVYADPSGPVERYSLAPPPEHLHWLQTVYAPHASRWWGWLAVAVVASLTLVLYALVWTAWRARLVT